MLERGPNFIELDPPQAIDPSANIIGRETLGGQGLVELAMHAGVEQEPPVFAEQLRSGGFRK